MCNCIRETEAELIKIGSYKGHQILKAEIPGALVESDSGYISKMFTDALCLVDGFKKEQRVNLLFTYCPFCGQRYELPVIIKELKDGTRGMAVLKLDKNFHVYAHGGRDSMLFESDSEGTYIKLYYKNIE